MTSSERINAVAARGFTTRQAAFLTTVMLHAGVCAQRQYRTFANIQHGPPTCDFFATLVARRYATAYPCVRRGAQLYHIHHKGLYRAIGEPDSRYRRPASVARAIERLMIVDAILAAPEVTWLATERDKVAYFVHTRGLTTSDLPVLTFGIPPHDTRRYFADRQPIGVMPTQEEILVLFLVTEPTARSFSRFLWERRRLLQRLPRWGVRLLMPRALLSREAVHRQAFDDFCGPPLRSAVIEEFRWFCLARRACERERRPLREPDLSRYATDRRAFGAPRFYAAYRRWLTNGDVAFADLASPLLHDAWRSGAGRLETYVLGHTYQQLAPLARTA